MFGYVRVRTDTLGPEFQSRYEAAYCGMCRALAQRYGAVSRCFLNYDFVFLAMLLDTGDGPCAIRCRRCPRHPVKGKAVCDDAARMATAAGESVILTWWKLQDTIRDGTFFSRQRARLLALMLKRGYRRARADFPDFDAGAAQLLRQLGELEERQCPSIDQTADLFARLLQLAAPPTADAALDRPRQQLLYHLGRWIYLIDAVDDLDADRAAGEYNPVAVRFPAWGEAEQTYLRQNLDHSLALMGAAFQLLPPGQWSGILENILYSGLPAVEELVFSGRWGKRRAATEEKSL